MSVDRPSVCLAISSFRNDQSVIALVESALSSDYFDEVLVVDSLGTSVMAQTIEERDWSARVHYENHLTNLGSAGNFARRLQLAADRGHDWVYAINHDGEVDPSEVRKLVECAGSLSPRVGAVYPMRFLPRRKAFDLTGTRLLPLFRGTANRPSVTAITVRWGSSNGALYSLDAVRAGITPPAELWMGWEDLLYGWRLRHARFTQHIIPAARANDPYEYTNQTILGRDVYITDKPTWYAYYSVRNLLLGVRDGRFSALERGALLLRASMEAVAGVTIRRDRRTRASLMAQAIRDGVRGRTGKAVIP